jgi:teichuronic acid biosynthesis glycosyltransferase TuaC
MICVAWLHNFEPSSPAYINFIDAHIKKLQDSNVKAVPIYITKIWKKSGRSLPKFYYLLNSLLKHSSIVHVQYGSGSSLVGLLVRKKTKILTLRGSDWYGYQSIFPISDYLRGVLAYTITRLVLISGSYSLILCQSHRMRMEILSLPNLYPSKVHVLSTGIDLSRFAQFTKQAAREILGIPPSSKVILFASARKHNSLKREHLVHKSIAVASQLDSSVFLVTLKSQPPDIVPLYMCAADLFLLLSLHEGWPNVIKESLASNLPFVSTDVSDLGLVAARTNNCKIVRPEAADVALGIINALNAPLSPSLQGLAKPFDINTVALKLAEVYRLTLLDDR